jgi:DNA-binding transcriptional ArsR family regulator
VIQAIQTCAPRGQIDELNRSVLAVAGQDAQLAAGSVPPAWFIRGAYFLTGIFLLGNIRTVPDVFAVLAEPTRRRILDALRGEECTVGQLVRVLGLPQPVVSKHLKVLRNGGFVSCRSDAQRRVYRIEPRQFEVVDRWLDPYRELWRHHADAREGQLDNLG